MGDSHYASNLKGKEGTETISNFDSIECTTVTGTTVTGTTVTGTTVNGTTVRATNYTKVGDRYIFSGGVTENSASVVAAATALVTAASLPGSLYLNEGGTCWVYTSSSAATNLL